MLLTCLFGENQGGRYAFNTKLCDADRINFVVFPRFFWSYFTTENIGATHGKSMKNSAKKNAKFSKKPLTTIILYDIINKNCILSMEERNL